jgi:hypothetical protein
MNENLWLEATSPDLILHWLDDNAVVTGSNRQLLLFTAAVCWHQLSGERARQAAREHESCLASRGYDAVNRARAVAHAVREELAITAARDQHQGGPASISYWSASIETVAQQLAAEQAQLLRDVLGNPFSPVLVPTSAEVRCLAQAAYDERDDTTGQLDPIRLAVLADALEESGASEDVLLALRDTRNARYRGFWVVDRCLFAY